MQTLNQLTLLGNITKDFVNKSGNAYSTIAVNTYKGETMYVDIVAFKGTAEYCLNFIRKGAKVVVNGSLNISKYQDKTYVQCAVREIINLSNKNNFIQEEDIDEEEVVDEPVATDEEIDNSSLPF